MERMSEEEFINNVEGHITSLKNLDNKALKILVGKLEEENKKLKEENEKMRKHIRENGYIDDVAYIKKENKKLKEENEKLRIDREFEKGNTIFGM